MVWCKKARRVILLLSHQVLIYYYKKEENNNFNASFQGFISVWRKIHISVTRVTLPYQLMFGIIPWENKLDYIFSLLQHS